MPMTVEERRIYNEKYYIKHKKRIADMLLTKVTCPLCNRNVAHSSLQRHQTTQLCIRRRDAVNTDKASMENLQAQIDKLMEELLELKN
jgi:hypothetical protein